MKIPALIVLYALSFNTLADQSVGFFVHCNHDVTVKSNLHQSQQTIKLKYKNGILHNPRVELGLAIFLDHFFNPKYKDVNPYDRCKMVDVTCQIKVQKCNTI